ncbi:MAG: phenylacetate--CoA ligase [Gemmatimonadetes bacterium]|nr:phenylacetate--CoA ligase [Gemmatimonadota bacterium]
MIFEPAFETLDTDAMRALQGQRLRALVATVQQRVSMYRERLAATGIAPDDIRSIDDITRLPITRKDDLRDHYPFGLLAVPRQQVMRVHASSGTTGKATVVAYTANDVDLFARVNARALAMAGAAPGMMLHNAYGYGLFTGGLGIHYGGERLGLSVVPVSGGMTERQLTLITDFRPEVITCTPSYALTLASEFRRRGVDPSDISLRYAVLGAEPWTDAMRAQIDAALGVTSTNIYGLVITTLTKEALPLLRYWTGDITSLVRGRCACGRTLVRMRLIKGRTDDMLIIRGVNVYPSQIEAVLGRIVELAPHYRLVVSRDGTLDAISVHAEVSESFFREVGRGVLSADVIEADHRLRALRERIAALLRDLIGVAMAVELIPPGEAPRSEGGKLNRVVDRRPR